MNAIKPMLAVSGQPFSREGWIFEPKIDGTRCIASAKKGVLLSNRRLADITYRYPELEKALADGKDKIKPSQSPERVIAKRMTKAAPKMFETFGSLRTDPAYNSLSSDIRSKIEDLLKSIDQEFPGLDPQNEDE